jgi:hypothetical protein
MLSIGLGVSDFQCGPNVDVASIRNERVTDNSCDATVLSNQIVH